MDLLDSMRIYVLAVEKGSLSAAAAAGPMSVVYLPDRYRTPRLRSFVDFVVERFG